MSITVREMLLDTRQMTENMRSWAPDAVVVSSQRFAPYFVSKFGFTIHKTAGVTLAARDGFHFSRVDGIGVCGWSTYHACFYKRMPRARCGPPFKKCQRCFT